MSSLWAPWQNGQYKNTHNITKNGVYKDATDIKKLLFFVFNINGGDVQRQNVVNNVDKSSLWAPWQNGPYKNTQNITQHGVNKDATDIKK